MNKETKAQEKEVRVRQPLTARRVGDLLLNNALIIIMIMLHGRLADTKL